MLVYEKGSDEQGHVWNNLWEIWSTLHTSTIFLKSDVNNLLIEVLSFSQPWEKLSYPFAEIVLVWQLWIGMLSTPPAPPLKWNLIFLGFLFNFDLWFLHTLKKAGGQVYVSYLKKSSTFSVNIFCAPQLEKKMGKMDLRGGSLSINTRS